VEICKILSGQALGNKLSFNPTLAQLIKKGQKAAHQIVTKENGHRKIL
jgi:hypothetical protein